jgi:hypothetical protein
MAAELITGLSAFKAMFDAAKGLKDINDTTIRNGAIVELQEKILTAQAQQTALVERVSELEKEVAAYKDWDREKERYQLTDFGCGTFAYSLKPNMANGEPPHRICAQCYQGRHKGFLQSHGRFSGGREKVECLGCGKTVMLGCEGERQTRAVSRYDPFA